MKGAKVGIENTLVLDIEDNELLSIYRKLDIISSIDIFQNLHIRKVRDLLESSKTEVVKAGELVIREGEKGEKFYIIAEGIVRAYSETLGYYDISKNICPKHCNIIIHRFERYYETGDYFGEAALKKGARRTAK